MTASPAARRRPRSGVARRSTLDATGNGVRAYLVIAGGIEAEAFLGSTSVDRYGLIGRALKAGDVLGLDTEDTAARDARPPAGGARTTS